MYVKVKTNLLGRTQQEAGFATPLVSYGNVSLSGNIGYASVYPNWRRETGWTAGVSLNYRLTSQFNVYAKTGTDLLNKYGEETGGRYLLFRNRDVAVNSNLAYAFNLPYHAHEAPRWTFGVTVSVPLKRLFAGRPRR